MRRERLLVLCAVDRRVAVEALAEERFLVAEGAVEGAPAEAGGRTEGIERGVRVSALPEHPHGLVQRRTDVELLAAGHGVRLLLHVPVTSVPRAYSHLGSIGRIIFDRSIQDG
jgi:hypothetical protein